MKEGTGVSESLSIVINTHPSIWLLEATKDPLLPMLHPSLPITRITVRNILGFT